MLQQSVPNDLSSRTSTQASLDKAVISHNPLETGLVIVTRQSHWLYSHWVCTYVTKRIQN